MKVCVIYTDVVRVFVCMGGEQDDAQKDSLGSIILFTDIRMIPRMENWKFNQNVGQWEPRFQLNYALDDFSIFI